MAMRFSFGSRIVLFAAQAATLAIALAAVAGPLAGCRPAPTAAAAAAAPAARCAPELRDYSRRWLLTGEVATRDPVLVVVPTVPLWPLTVRFLVEGGQQVRAGEKLAEFDGTQMLSKLDAAETRVATARNDLEAAGNRASADLAELTLDRGQKLAARDRAVVAARLPEELVPAQEVAEKELALERAELELAAAQAKLERSREVQEATVAVSRLELEQALAELAEIESTLQRLTLVAPTGGVFFAGDHPREPRPLKAGDDVWPGFQLGRIPSAAGWQIEAKLPDVDDGRIAEGQEARIFLDGDPAAGGLRGRVRGIDAIAQEISRDSPRRAFALVVEVEEFAASHPSGLASRLRPGMSARVEVIEPSRRVPVLPRTCVAELAAARVVSCAAQECELMPAGDGTGAAGAGR